MERFDVAENESSEIRFTESGGARYPGARHSAFLTNVPVLGQSSIDVCSGSRETSFRTLTSSATPQIMTDRALVS